MAYQFNPEDYGLTKTDKSGHPDDGIVSDGQGNYYKIDGFKREQNDDLDTDQGDVFQSDLEKHARRYTDFDVSDFNTGSDVEKAVRMLSSLNSAPETPVEKVYNTQSFEEAYNERNLSDSMLAALDFRKERTARMRREINDLNAKKQFAAENNLGLYGGSGNLSNAFKSGTISENAQLNEDGEWELTNTIQFDPNAEKLELMKVSSNKALDHIIDKY